MLTYLLLVLSIIFAAANGLLLHGYHNRGLRGLGDILLFNSLISCVWSVIMFPLNGFSPISSETFWWGFLFGITIAAQLLCKMQALATGSASITTLVGCSSMLIPTAIGIMAFRENVFPLQVVGAILLLMALFLCCSLKTEKVKYTWIIWCILFFFSNSAVGVIFKFHQASENAGQVNGMMLVASLVSAVFLALISVVVSKKQENSLPRVPRSIIIFVICCGIASCGYNRLNISLTGLLPSIIFFPIFNGSVILLTSLLSAICFKEKLKKAQLFGLILGVVALMLTAGVIDNILALLK